MEPAEVNEIQRPEKTLKEILLNIRKAYMKAGAINADPSESYILLKGASTVAQECS